MCVYVTCVYVYIVCVYVYMCISVYIILSCAQLIESHIPYCFYVDICTCINSDCYMYIHIYSNISMHIYTHACMSWSLTYISIYLYAYIYLYSYIIHIHIHIYIHIYIYTYPQPFYMVRKAGKLPHAVSGHAYSKEYKGDDKNGAARCYIAALYMLHVIYIYMCTWTWTWMST
jgi:hypothetical protein